MKKTIKSVMAMALALVLTASSLGSTAFAAASVSTTLGGHAATASIAERSDGAVATTRIAGVTNAYTYAKAIVYYRFDRDECYSVADDQQTNGYAVATAYVKRIPGRVCGGLGSHTIYYNNLTWNPQATQFGEILSGATRYD